MSTYGSALNSSWAKALRPEMCIRDRGQTVLENVAKEPHIVDVANFLNMMGADVRGAGTDVIKIRGVKQMHGLSLIHI